MDRQRIGLGVSLIPLDLPDDLTYLPKITYQRQFQPRVSGAAEAGYLRYEDFDNTFRQVPELRKRFTLDLAAKYSLVKLRDSHLKIAAGPSLWRIDDLITKRLSFESNEVTTYELLRRRYWNFGANLGLELDVNLSNRFSVMGNFQMVYLEKEELTPLLGLYAFYRIR